MLLTFLLVLIQITNNFALNDSRIKGGYSCSTQNYGFMVLVQSQLYSGQIGICGGTLLNSNWVLTAAHCYEPYAIKTTILASANNIQQLVDVKQWYTHPNYYSDLDHGGVTMIYDIALLELREPLFESYYGVRYVTLPKNRLNDPGNENPWCLNGLAMGWGEMNKGAGDHPNILQCASLSIISLDKCRKLLGRLGEAINPCQICISHDTGTATVLKGDSGGPLLCGDVQVGISSFIFHVVDIAIFTQVSCYLDFIHSSSEKCCPWFLSNVLWLVIISTVNLIL